MPNGLVIGDDERVSAWAFQTYRLVPSKYDHAVGIIDPVRGTLVGAILLQCWNGNDIQVSYYGEGSMSAQIIRAIARMVCAIGAQRLTTVTHKRNRKLQQFWSAIGFRLEGTMKRFYGPLDIARHTGVRFVMFREQLEHLADPQRRDDPHTQKAV